MTEINLKRFEDVLDRPGSGVLAMGEVTGPKLGDQVTSDAKDEQTQADATSAADNADVISDEEEKVPKSRFRKTREELIELRHKDELRNEQLKRLESELEDLRTRRVDNSASEGDMPSWWKDRWGDSDQSKASWDTYHQTMKDERRYWREEQARDQERQRTEQIQREQAISNQFDTQLEDLESSLGKEFSDKQAAELLGIVESYSPVDENGNFESFISLDKAYEIYDLKQRGNRSASKDQLSRISGASSQGETQTNPGPARPQWGDWRRRIGG